MSSYSDETRRWLLDGIRRNVLAEATGAAASNLDIYQVNCTFYDALGRGADGG